MTDPIDPTDDPLSHYIPATLAPRRLGWTAERQRQFLTILAETGSVSTAAEETGIAPRSAYRLRAHPEGKNFAAAWDDALLSSTGRLLALAFERAAKGIPRQTWRDDKLVSQSRQPSEKLMMFLLTHLMPKRFGAVAPEMRVLSDPSGYAQRDLPVRIAQLTDTEVHCDMLMADDFDCALPGAEIG